MSANAPSPLFNLVREDTMETTLGLNYNSGSDEQDFFDEVCLKNPNGEAACHSVDQAYVDKDIRYEYIDGTLGKSNRILRHRISVDVDYIGDDVRRKLLMWMQERARVLFTPGYGASTEFAYRMPSIQYIDDLGSPTHTDLTGRWQTIFNGPSGLDHSHTWDNIMQKGYMRQEGDQWGRYINTPGGHGGVHEPKNENIAAASSPVGTTFPGQTCWRVTGGLSMAYEANGFGYEPSCEGALRITGSGSTAARSVYYDFSSAMGGSQKRVDISVWIRGNPGNAAKLQLSLNGDTTTQDITTENIGDWTRLSIVGYRSTITSAIVYIHCPLSTQPSNTAQDFWIGPVSILEAPSEWRVVTPNWSLDGSPRSNNDSITVANFKYPQRGSVFASFYIPADFPANSVDPHEAAHLCNFAIRLSLSSGRFGLFKMAGSSKEIWVAFYMNVGGTAVKTENMTHNWIVGGVNVIAATWTPGGVRVYVNGKFMNERTDMRDFSELTTTATMFLYANDAYGTWPLIPLHTRIDRELFDDTQIANISAAMQNPGALEVVVPARGRIYRITGVPSTPRSSTKTTHWLGRLELEQVDYNYQWADETTKENF